MPDHENILNLRDLGELVAAAKANVKNFTKPAEFGVSATFMDALKASFPEYSFDFYDRTIKVGTPNGQHLYVSGQSFALAVCLMDFCEEIGRYRATAYRILNNNQEVLKSLVDSQSHLDEEVFPALKAKTNKQLTDTFTDKAEAFFASKTGSTRETAKANTERLMRFLTDYDWWHGGKSINRSNDWFISPVSTLLNMPQNDSNFIARVVGKTTEVATFREAFKQAIAHEWTVETHAGNSVPKSGVIAENILLYGVPGCGKSHTIKTEYCDDDAHMERAVFHPDYTYSDFAGQILPRVNDGHIEYRFEAGPFTRILKKAIDTPEESFYLVVEEINRGNAPAIFGDIFQLLDRDDSGCSEYGVSNENIAAYVYGDNDTKIKIPGNLYVLATMNTSDQNVFTLDTAFKRRWTMRMIDNNIDACEYANAQICAWGITWGTFAKTINQKITELGESNLSNEDNRLGAYFVRESDLQDAKRFGEKVLMYLWNDAFKFDRDKVFKTEYRTLDELISAFVHIGFGVFNDDIIFASIAAEQDDFFVTDTPTAEQYLEGKNPELVESYRTLLAAVREKIPNAYDATVGSLSYVAWKSNDIRTASFADIIIQRNKILIWTEAPATEQVPAIGEQMPVDKHHNHYFKITFDAAQMNQIVSIIEEAYNQLKVQ